MINRKIIYLFFLIILLLNQEKLLTQELYTKIERQEILKELPKLIPFRNKAGKYGYVDKNMNIIIACKYEKAWHFSKKLGLATVKFKGKWGCIDSTEKVVIGLKYNLHKSRTFV